MCCYGCYFPKTVCGFDNAIYGEIGETIDGTNIDAEGYAILKCCDIFAKLKYHNVNCEFIIVSDSEFWLRIINGTYKCKAKKQLMERIDKYLNMINVKFYFINSHNKELSYDREYYNLIEDYDFCIEEFRLGNKEADRVATSFA